jgi:UDP-N-acetylglucosamine--N-acetylmuramyl-(pentapeptide) pyrophosphoryl-undecaprenol N-acetylglucosamine transferase
MINKIVFAAGGTGGHIYPAIAVADELRKANMNVNIKFIGAKGRIEEKIVPRNGYELETIDVHGFKRSLSPKNIKVVLKFMKASREAKIFLKEYKPEIVFGTGGFVSGPVLWSASQLGIPSVIQEGNSYPGITVKWLSSKVDKVIINFEETKRHLKRQDNIEVMPYPVRTKLKRYSKMEALKYFGLNEGIRTLFVFGGSQGASSINNALSKIQGNLAGNNIQIIWQTGESFYDTATEKTKRNRNIKVLKYIDSIDYAYSAADLIVCRAGISTVMELASFGAAAIFVPYPLASENHQEKNARALLEKKAGVMILDSRLNEKLEDMINLLINDEDTLNGLRNNIKQFADQDAALKISKLLIGLVNNSKN